MSGKDSKEELPVPANLILRVLFLSLGLLRIFPRLGQLMDNINVVVEPDGARVCRRNILALSIAVVLTYVVGANPRDLEIFGAKPSDDWGVLVLGLAVMLAHVYWYTLRYYHVRDDRRDEHNFSFSGEDTKYSRLHSLGLLFTRRDSDLISNRAAFALTILSWYVIGMWIFEGLFR